ARAEPHPSHTPATAGHRPGAVGEPDDEPATVPVHEPDLTGVGEDSGLSRDIAARAAGPRGGSAVPVISGVVVGDLAGGVHVPNIEDAPLPLPAGFGGADRCGRIHVPGTEGALLESRRRPAVPAHLG